MSSSQMVGSCCVIKLLGHRQDSITQSGVERIGLAQVHAAAKGLLKLIRELGEFEIGQLLFCVLVEFNEYIDVAVIRVKVITQHRAKKG